MIPPIPEPGKIDIHKIKPQYTKALARFHNSKALSKKNIRLISDFLKDCELGKTVIGKEKKRIGTVRLNKYLVTLRKIAILLGKDLDKVVVKDIEAFVSALENDRIRAKSGRPYKDSCKRDIKITIRKFYKWLYGDNREYPKLVNWIDTHAKDTEIPALKRDEVEKLVAFADSIRNKAIILTLFDSGARVEELLNIRMKHVEEVDGQIKIRIEFSKTKPRSIYLPICSDMLKGYIASHPDKNNPEYPLFPITYDALKKLLRRAGEKVLKKRVTPHVLRHTSATYYCTKLNPYQLCYRYGWSMSSKQPSRYIDREALIDRESVEKVRQDDLSVLSKENRELREDYARLNEVLKKLMERNIKTDAVLEHILSLPQVRKEIGKKLSITEL